MMRRLIDPQLACRTAFAVVAFALSSSAHAACEADSYELPVKIVGARAVATVGINGTNVPLTVDSGAFFSMLTEAAAGQLKLKLSPSAYLRLGGVTGQTMARSTTVDKLTLMKGEFERVQFVVGGTEPGAGTMGFIGRNILAVGDTEYDLAHGMIRFMFPNRDCKAFGMAYWAGNAPVTELDLIDDGRSKTPEIRAKVGVNGNEFTALFDTGATSVMSAKTARSAGIAETDWKPGGYTYGITRDRVRSWTVPFARFQIGAEAVANGRLHVADLNLGDADMLLGIDFFLSHRIYVSRQQSKIFMTYAGGPVFALDRVDKAAAGNGEANESMTADDYARRASASAARRDYASALADLDRACGLDPASAEFLTQRAGIQIALKHPDRALEDYGMAIDLDPKQADARFQRASMRLRAKDFDGARSDLDALDDALPEQAQMRFAMAGMYLTLEQPARAIVQIDQWLPAHPKEIGRERALDTRCWARMLLGTELDRAKEDCDDAVDGDAKNAGYLGARGWVLLRQGKYDKALADFDRSLAIAPKYASALYGRGVARTRLGDPTKGEEDLAAARALQPEIERRLAPTGMVTASAATKP